jgi:DNA polymerase-3 subunit alpha
LTVNGRAPDIAALLREFPAQREMGEQGELVRGLPVRLEVLRESARCEVQLGERAMFFPSDAALARWMAQAQDRRAEIAYDGESGF